MSQISPKTAKEDIARALAAAKRMQASKALSFAGQAFLATGTSSLIVGRAKIEIEVLLADMLRELSLLPEVKALTKGAIVYKRGMETRIGQALVKMAQFLDHREAASAEDEEKKRQDDIDQAFAKARQAVAEQNLATARRLLNTICETYPEHPCIFSSAGKILAEAGLHRFVIPFAEQAMEKNPKDAQAFSLGVEAAREIGEYPKAETYLREALKNFGAHPRTYVSLAKVLYQMGQWDKAYDAARSAYDRDSSLAEAKEILDLTEKKVMG